MDFSLSEDQLAVVGELDKLAARFDTKPTDFDGFALYTPDIEAELAANEYFDIASIPEMGAITAALAVERLAKLPYATEVALSMLVRPHLDLDVPRPLAVIEHGRPGRFLAQAKTVIVIDGEKIGIAHPEAADIEVQPESLYAYPMARLVGTPALKLLDNAQSTTVRTWLRIACAVEMAGLLQAAIDATVEHISVRKQFGRPLGTFQALRHRMAECAVLAGGVRHLALQAAWSGNAGDAALAALHAQESATRVIYDLHQMSGAMGMTLEMPLHLWTYRMKALLSELDGRGGQAQAVAAYCFAAGA